jgi:hypothetical protein
MVDRIARGAQVTEYPKQPPPRDGWPSQPPRYSASRDGQGGYPQSAYGQNEYRQDEYGQSGYPQPGYQQNEYGQNDYRQNDYRQNDYGQPGHDLESPAGYQQDQNGHRAPRRRRRRRGWIALAVTLVVLAVLFVVGDQIAKSYAQNMIATKLESSSGLTTKPSVTIEGFPFLTQVAAHDIRTVDISASNVQADKLDITNIKATATGVHLNSSFSGATIDHISGTALISFASLVNATGAQGVTVTADPSGGPDAANVSFGPLTATAQITQTGPSQITVRVDSLDGISPSQLGLLSDYKIDVPPLPAGLQVQGVSVTHQGIVIKVAAQNTTLSQ